MRRNKHLLDLLLELQALDRVPRIGYALRGVADPESVSEHTFQTAFLAWSLAGEVPELDRARVVELAMVHDLAEVRLGDLPRSAASYLPREVKHHAERTAMRDLMAPLGEEGVDLLAEYQAGETAEARFVSACDKLQLLIKVWTYETWGAGRNLEEMWDNLEDFPDGGFAVIRRLLAELRSRRDSEAPTTAGKS